MGTWHQMEHANILYRMAPGWVPYYSYHEMAVTMSPKTILQKDRS